MKKYILLFGLLMFSVNNYAQEKSASTVIAPAEYHEQIKKGEKVQLVDVRTPEEFAEGHIAGAENIDFRAENFLEQFRDMDKSRALYIYCRSGKRSSEAAKKLTALGFEKVIDLEGGFLSWTQFIKE